MKSLITGGAGFIGYHISRLLAEQNQNITICDNFFRGKKDDEFKELIKRKNVKIVKCDLTKKEELNKLEKDYDFVYHLAAINGTKYFYAIPETVLRTNTLATINILDWFIKTNCKKILFSSSSETYACSYNLPKFKIPTPEDVPLSIKDINNPRWSYAGSKIIGELFFINYAKRYNFDMSIVRYHNIYGPRMGHEHVIPEFCLRILKKENPFKIMGSKETRAFCYVGDSVNATKLVMESKNTNNQIVHIGNDKEEISIADLAKKMFKIAAFHPKLEIKSAPKGSVKRRCPNINKLRKLTGFEPEIELNEGLKRTFEWYKNEI